MKAGIISNKFNLTNLIRRYSSECGFLLIKINGTMGLQARIVSLAAGVDSV